MSSRRLMFGSPDKITLYRKVKARKDRCRLRGRSGAQPRAQWRSARGHKRTDRRFGGRSAMGQNPTWAL